MNKVSNIKCDFCGSTDCPPVYKPIGTKRNNRVCICNNCGLVFSIHDDIPYSREPNPSGDADWGNIRFCKTQRFEEIKQWMPTDVKRVLDVGSSRGHFVRWMKEHNPSAEITAIEPDGRIADFPNDITCTISKLEDVYVALRKNHFDFVYCVQTLEHSDSASAMLKQIYDLLVPNGTLFLEVPNIEAYRFPQNIEECFIDKHNFHFSKGVLVNYMLDMGFDVAVNLDDLNVRIFATKNDEVSINKTEFRVKSIVNDPHELIKTYAENIQRNRAKLPAVVEKINRFYNNVKVAYWGANVLFDLMVKYGGLDPKKTGLLVDDYIYEYLDQIHGVPVKHSDALRVYQPDVCIVLARHGADIVAEKARKFGIRNIVKFYDLLEAK